MYARKASDHVIQNSISDSDTLVNPVDDSSGIIIRGAATPRSMQRNRDDVVSSFVRLKIREWRESKRELQELARVAGFAKSTPSQVLTGTGVGNKTGPGFARAFGYASHDALKMGAWEWWQANNESPAAASPTSPSQQEACDLVVGLGQGTSEQVATVLHAYAHPRFLERDKDWWIQTLLDELRRDRDALVRDQDLRKQIVNGQKVMREATAEKHARSQHPPQPAKKARRAS